MRVLATSQSAALRKALAGLHGEGLAQAGAPALALGIVAGDISLERNFDRFDHRARARRHVHRRVAAFLVDVDVERG